MKKLTQNLMKWYAKNKNNYSMPWRGEKDAYKIWVSETMLQQTQVATVVDYYKRWIKRFPDIKSVAEAPEDDVLKMWEGLGYYSRARNFQASCKILKERGVNQVPNDYDEFLKLKGVGPYIASAV